MDDKLMITRIAGEVSDAIKGAEPLHKTTVLLSYLIGAAKEAGLNKKQVMYLVDKFFDNPKSGGLIFN